MFVCSADERNMFMVGFFLVAFGMYIVMPFPGRSMPIQPECKSVAFTWVYCMWCTTVLLLLEKNIVYVCMYVYIAVYVLLMYDVVG